MSKTKRRRRSRSAASSNGQASRPKNRSGTTLTVDFWRGINGFGENDAGVSITPKILMSYAPIYYAVSRIAGHIGMMPIKVKQEIEEGGKRTVRDAEAGEIRAERLLNVRPNALMSPMIVRETATHHAIVSGNGRLGILRDRLGEPAELIPIDPARSYSVLFWREIGGGGSWLPEKWHIVINDNGERITIRDADVVHILGLGADGIVGWGLVELAKQSVGGALAAEKFMNRTFKNNAVPGLILEAPPDAFSDDEEALDFIETFNRFHSGVDQANKVGLLRFGIKANPLTMSGRDGQFIEQRRFSREEAALFTLIESMIGIDKSTSYNSLEQRNQAYLQNCLGRWVVKWEQEIRLKLLTEEQREAGYFFSFDVRAIARGSTSERYGGYTVARQIGLMSQEEIRREEGLGEIDPNENFGNPNTTPAAGGDQADSDSDSDSDSDEDEPDEVEREDLANRLFGVVRSQLTRFIGVEVSRLVDLATAPDTFLDRVDRFYSGGFGDRLAELVKSLGGDDDLAAEYVEESRRQVLDVAGQATADQLLDKVTQSLLSWPADRSATLATTITKGNQE